jgi:hypothetical protein
MFAKPTGMTFEVAGTAEQAVAAWRVVHQTYRRAGLIHANAQGIHLLPHAATNDAVVARGCVEGLCVSTLSAYVDDPDHGLPLDSVYRPELDRLREDGHRLLELGLFADRRAHLDRSFHALLELMRLTTWFGLHRGCTHAVIGVHPHHAPFYRRMLGFEASGDPTTYDVVNDHPVVLLTLDWQAQTTRRRVPRGLRILHDQPIPDHAFDHRPAHDALRSHPLIDAFIEHHATGRVFPIGDLATPAQPLPLAG